MPAYTYIMNAYHHNKSVSNLKNLFQKIIIPNFLGYIDIQNGCYHEDLDFISIVNEKVEDLNASKSKIIVYNFERFGRV